MFVWRPTQYIVNSVLFYLIHSFATQHRRYTADTQRPRLYTTSLYSEKYYYVIYGMPLTTTGSGKFLPLLLLVLTMMMMLIILSTQ